MTRHRRRQHRIRWRSIFLWHRYLGLASAAFVVLLAVTGLLLNHTGELKLDQRHVRAGWLLDWYGIAAPNTIPGFNVAGHHVAQLGAHLYFDRREIAADAGHLVGAVALEEVVVVGTTNELFLLTRAGELIEHLGSAQGTPEGMQALGRAGDRLLVRAADGAYSSDTMFLEWSEYEAGAAAPRWALPARTPHSLRRELINRYRGSGLSQERVILDLHSGRILGRVGVYLIDAAAVAFLVLAALGVWVWASRQRK